MTFLQNVSFAAYHQGEFIYFHTPKFAFDLSLRLFQSSLSYYMIPMAITQADLSDLLQLKKEVEPTVTARYTPISISLAYILSIGSISRGRYGRRNPN